MKTAKARPRGRPGRTAKQRAQHALIGRVAWRLYAWGYSLRGPNGALSATARAALRILKVGGHGGGRAQPLSEERVEQLMEEWAATAPYWRRTGRPSPSRWTVASRRERAPMGLHVDDLAAQLIARQGEWPSQRAVDLLSGKPIALHGDLALTRRHAEQLVRLMPRIRVTFRPPGEQTG